jgi:hypothetical protein
MEAKVKLAEMFPCTLNSEDDPRKGQPISKVYEEGDGQSKVTQPEV